MTKRAKKSAEQYGAHAIQVLKGLDAVRRRPGMYIGSTSERGLHHLIWEVVDNSVDEAMAGHCRQITVTLHDDGSVSVQDDGRGIPTDIHPIEKKPGVELALTVLHAGGKFDKNSYTVAGGLHGVGVSVVNALSEWLVAVVDQRGGRFEMMFDRGAARGPLKKTGSSKRTGTMIRFKPDAEIFDTVEFDYATVARRLRQTACLNAGLEITLRDERAGEPRTEVFLFEHGIVEIVASLNEGKQPIHDPITVQGEADGVYIDLALQYNSRYNEDFLSFVNTIRTPGGGTHETGFRAALTHAVTSYIAEHGNKNQQKVSVQGGDLKEGLAGVLAVRVSEPQFEGQTKDKLGNSEVRGIVQRFLSDALKRHFEENPKTIKALIDKAVSAARGREAARRARDIARGQKSLLEAGVLAGKLADCSSNDASMNEVFIVEGDSAGGSAKQGRNRGFQAVLPIKGKILNTEKASMEKILANEEVKAIITALGTGILHDFDVSKLRYHRVIIMCDADVDGAHIKTLLLTLFFRHMRPLIENGHVYIAQPPLYLVRKGKQQIYAYNDAERDEAVRRLGDGQRGSGSVQIQRYKGLGEMNPEQLWSTTMDPDGRLIFQVDLDDAVEADRAFRTLMGDDVAPRREWIMANATFVKHLDV